MQEALREQGNSCEQEQSTPLVRSNQPANQSPKSPLQVDISTFCLVATLILLLSAMARIIYFNHPFTTGELAFLMWGISAVAMLGRFLK
jgi:hypothetical protein